MTDGFAKEDLISKSPASARFFMAVPAMIFGALGASLMFSEYVIHTKTVDTSAWTMFGLFFALFLASGLFFAVKSVDAVYAQVNLLSIQKGKKLIQIPYSDIKNIRVWKGRSEHIAWVRLSRTTDFGRGFLFIAPDNYKTAWASHTSTRYLWNKVNNSD
jgi:hypothetical protein